MKTLFTTLVLLSCALASCNSNSPADHSSGDMNHSRDTHHTMEASSIQTTSAAVTDMSLYNLNSKWATQKGDSIELKALKGKVQIVAMIYTNCDYACPRILADLKRIEESLDEKKKNETGIVLVTLDPERDNPEKLQDYAQKNRLNPDRWISLTGKEDNVMELAALLNVKYRKELSMDIAHSNIISVLNEEGELVHQQEGLGVDPSETVNAITALLKSL